MTSRHSRIRLSPTCVWQGTCCGSILVLPALWEVFWDNLCSLVEKSPGNRIAGISITISLHHMGTPVL